MTTVLQLGAIVAVGVLIGLGVVWCDRKLTEAERLIDAPLAKLPKEPEKEREVVAFRTPKGWSLLAQSEADAAEAMIALSK